MIVFFCLTNITGFNASSRKNIKYPNLRSADSISLEDIESTYSGTSGNEPHWITQEDLNDLARDLYLSKQQSVLLASRLKQRGSPVSGIGTKTLLPFSTWKTSCVTAQTYLACLRPYTAYEK